MIDHKGKGSYKRKGNISDRQIHLIVGVPLSTLTDWKGSDNYRKTLYWTLKSMTKVELLEFKEISKEFTN